MGLVNWTNNTGAANRAFLYPLYLPQWVIAKAIEIVPNVGAVNFDLGIYRWSSMALATSRDRLYSSGPLASPGAGVVLRHLFPNGGLYLPAGYVWLAAACDGANGFRSATSAPLSTTKYQLKDASYPLPAAFSGMTQNSGSIPAICIEVQT